ncbi:YagK/YfjJ domain-containing protein [Undibacterium griseum]|uniref:Inovirus-type Gp2 protein n=1 Tax=Undibacterium griseum TaxID=2762295 RepID=A0ABR6YJV6_9BURK|nr:inovirus-type Gp2 protein [Undibacterium griseum]MBC3884109.1 inovirus-type Gp2 protein [Undibacterium griseum]
MQSRKPFQLDSLQQQGNGSFDDQEPVTNVSNGYQGLSLDSECLDDLQAWVQALAKKESMTDSDMAMVRVDIDRYLDVIAKLPNEYVYSPCIEAFIVCSQEVRLLPACFLSTIQQCNELLVRLRQYCQTEHFREAVRIAQREADKRYRDYARYIDALFDRNDRIIVLRLDLSYQKIYTRQITLSKAMSDMERFLNNRRNNQLFKSNIGYILKTEYGIERGIHFHVLLFFNGSLRRGTSHVHHAQQIGEYWCNEVTMGQGSYWNCNQNIEEFKIRGICGIGVIHWSETDLRRHLQDYVLAYLCKLGQSFKPRQSSKTRMIRRGGFPFEQQIRLGRPRNIK